MSTYEKQLKWKKAVLSLSKAAQVREEEVDNSPHFTPQYFSVPLQDFEGSARQSTDKSSQIHIARQSKARKEKKEQLDRLKWAEKSKQSTSNSRSSSSGPNFYDDDAPATYENSFRNNFPRSGSRSRAHSHEESERRNMAFSEGDELSVVELLEKERKDWQLERLKLIHCIHLQQLELSQRSAAAYDRATDIAKEFASAIEGFEDRLIAIETNVQKEIMAIKIIAESIKAAVVGNHMTRIG